MAHDVLWLSIPSDHPDEIAVYMEDGRNPDGAEAGNTGSRTWPCSCRASPCLVSPLGLASLGGQPISFRRVGPDIQAKRNPRQRQGLQNVSRSVTLFPPREAFFLTD